MMSERAASRLVGLWRDYRQLVLFLALMFVFRSACADWVTVPTGSMNPTILEGDRLLVDKHAFGLRIPFTLVRLTDGEDPRRGDIVIFDSPADGTTLVKRVVGTPGDVVQIDDGVLIVNGEQARYGPASPDRVDELLSTTAALHPLVLQESGPAGEHEILMLPSRFARDFGPIEVPPGMYFVLGDNRDNSADSRVFGYVPRRNIVGRATHVLISFDPERYYAPRWHRSFLRLE